MRANIKKWTEDEVKFMESYWRTKKILGMSDTKIARELAKKFTRSYQSVRSKADQLHLTPFSARLAHEYLKPVQDHPS